MLQQSSCATSLETLDLTIMCLCVGISRTVFILSEALDEQLKTLWFSPFQTDDIESDLEMVSLNLCIFKGQKKSVIHILMPFI